jgi:hypothetical protein
VLIYLVQLADVCGIDLLARGWAKIDVMNLASLRPSLLAFLRSYASDPGISAHNGLSSGFQGSVVVSKLGGPRGLCLSAKVD